MQNVIRNQVFVSLCKNIFLFTCKYNTKVISLHAKITKCHNKNDININESTD